MDKKTAEKLYEAFYMKVFSYVMTLAKDRNDAEEITQETFFRAISTDKSFRGDSDSFTWLCAIAKNIFIDEKRRVANQDDELSEELPDTNKGIEEKLSDRDTSLKIHTILLLNIPCRQSEDRSRTCQSSLSGSRTAPALPNHGPG